MSDSLHEVLFFCFRRQSFAIKSLSSNENVLEYCDSWGPTSSAKYFRRVPLPANSVFHSHRVSPSVCACRQRSSRLLLWDGISWMLILETLCWNNNTYLLAPWSRVLLEKLTGFAANQEIPRILWNQKVHYRTHKRPPLILQLIIPSTSANRLRPQLP